MMSLIIYKDNYLYADRSGISEVPGTVYLAEMNKLFIPKHKKYALAYSGNEIDFTSKAFSSINKNVLKALKELNLISGIQTKIELPKPYNNSTFIILTLLSTYVIVKEEPFDGIPDLTTTSVPMTKINNKDFWSGGSASLLANALLASNKSVERIYELAAKFSTAMFKTEIDKVHRSQLKPL